MTWPGRVVTMKLFERVRPVRLEAHGYVLYIYTEKIVSASPDKNHFFEKVL